MGGKPKIAKGFYFDEWDLVSELHGEREMVPKTAKRFYFGWDLGYLERRAVSLHGEREIVPKTAKRFYFGWDLGYLERRAVCLYTASER